MFARRGNAGGVNLGKAGVRQKSAPFIGPPDRRNIAPLGIGGQIKNIAVAAGCQHHSVSHV